MIVYKVVNPIDGHWMSVIAKDTGLQLLYRVGHVTRPSFGKLFAFNSLGAAQTFRRCHGPGASVFLCDAQISGIHAVHCCYGEPTLNNVRRFWELTEQRKYVPSPGRAPDGTVFCDWVKLIELA